MLKRVLVPLAVSLGALLIASTPATAADPRPVERSFAPDSATASSQTDAVAAVHPPWYVTTFQYLRQEPREDMTTSCVEGTHTLGAGYYNWGYTFRGINDVGWYNLWLGAGDYKMATCLDPRDRYYTQTVWLDPATPGWETITIQSNLRILLGNGHYTWGAYLQPLF